MNAIAQNMANAETVETPEGGPYRRKQVVFSEDEKSRSRSAAFSSGLTVSWPVRIRIISAAAEMIGRKKDQVSSVDSKLVEDTKDPFKLVYDPSHPDADTDGYVKMPNVEIINEMVDMMTASRAYEANTSVISAAKDMAKNALEI